ncbi:MAG: UDP-N-acetylglucosamine 1-carboxyvinyltransferase [Clostridia bacterium]|nr:UDP-N-acetylglucosamine 1-carboxyvinyltransferase [Clostridia bacterium]
MERLIIEGGHRLYGEVNISGMKNSALPIIYACLLVKDECIIHNIPRVSDIYNSLEILRGLGADADFIERNTVRINTKNATATIKNQELVSKMRASSYLMGALFARFNEVCINMPGGCNFGVRPIEQHLKGFCCLGATCIEKDGKIEIKADKKLKSQKITLDKISVGATINMVLASIFIEGTTIIENCAIEPHVDDLICFLNKCGGKIIRKNRTILVNGANKLYGTDYTVFPDMIEALTYACFVGASNGEVLLNKVNVTHLRYSLDFFKSMGMHIKEYESKVHIKKSTVLNGVNVVTAPYPLFPTDLHPQLSALLCFTCDGGSVKDEIFPTRFAYVNELRKMGANITTIDNMAVIKPSYLFGARTDATDLRAGAALVTASLGAQGNSEISNVNYIIRGYECLVEKLTSIGGKIKLVNN